MSYEIPASDTQDSLTCPLGSFHAYQTSSSTFSRLQATPSETWWQVVVGYSEGLCERSQVGHTSRRETHVDRVFCAKLEHT